MAVEVVLMKLFNRTGEGRLPSGEEALRARFAAEDEARRVHAESDAAALLETLRTQVGDQFCSARGCKEETGISCSYLDRHERACPTAWCVEHRAVTHGANYCPQHASLLDGTDNGFGVHARADMGNQVPMLVNWVTREMDADVRRIIERVANEMHEQMIVEPVRFVLFGVERVRTWERSWKVVSHHGVSLRLAVAVEEAHPGRVLGKMNSKVATELAPPWNEEFPVGPEPESPEAAAQALMEFRRALFMGLARPAEEWLQLQLAGITGEVGSGSTYSARS